MSSSLFMLPMLLLQQLHAQHVAAAETPVVTSMHKIRLKIDKLLTVVPALKELATKLNENDTQQLTNALVSFENALIIDKDLENPITIYKIVRLTFDIRRQLRNNCIIGGKVNCEFLERMKLELNDFLFVMEDGKISLKAMVGLQWLYSIPASEVADGYFGENVQKVAPLTTIECQLLTTWSGTLTYFHMENEWLMESLQKKMEVLSSKTKQIFTVFAQDNAQRMYMEKLLNIFINKKHWNLAIYIMDTMTYLYGYHRYSSWKSLRKDGGMYAHCLEGVRKVPLVHVKDETGGKTYRKAEKRNLCLRERLSEDGFCRYAAPNTFYIIGPVQEEILSTSPLIKMWHKIVHPGELELLLRNFGDTINRAKVMDPSNYTKTKYSDIRTSENAFMQKIGEESKALVQKMHDRISALGGVTLEPNYRNHEAFQINNYGIGGFYDSHLDCLTASKLQRSVWKDPATGLKSNRIATAMLYISNVRAGGSTMFNKLHLNVMPRAGSMLFWMNMLRHGKADRRTLHGGCPVLSGSKWVINKWIRYPGQFKARPCSLNITRD